jgi:ATP synthase protein I
MGLAVVLGWFMGHWLDGKLGTDPYLMLLFVMCGVAAGFKGVIRVARQAKRADAAASDEE